MQDQSLKKFIMVDTDIDEINEEEIEEILTEVDNEPFEAAKAAVEGEVQKLRDVLTSITEEKHALQSAINTAQAVVDDTEATKEDVNNQLTALQAALNGTSTLSDLPEEEEESGTVDKSALTELIASANQKISEYDKKANPFVEAITAAENILNKDGVTTEELESYLPEIQDKVNELIPPEVEEEEDEDRDSPEHESEDPKTGILD